MDVKHIKSEQIEDYTFSYNKAKQMEKLHPRVSALIQTTRKERYVVDHTPTSIYKLIDELDSSGKFMHAIIKDLNFENEIMVVLYTDHTINGETIPKYARRDKRVDGLDYQDKDDAAYYNI